MEVLQPGNGNPRAGLAKPPCFIHLGDSIIANLIHEPVDSNMPKAQKLQIVCTLALWSVSLSSADTLPHHDALLVRTPRICAQPPPSASVGECFAPSICEGLAMPSWLYKYESKVMPSNLLSRFPGYLFFYTKITPIHGAHAPRGQPTYLREIAVPISCTQKWKTSELRRYECSMNDFDSLENLNKPIFYAKPVRRQSRGPSPGSGLKSRSWSYEPNFV